MSDAASHGWEDSVASGITAGGKPRWPALMAVLVALVLQLVLPVQGLGYGPWLRW